MPELPEVETVRRMLEANVLGRTIRAVRISGLRLREPIPHDLSRRLTGRRFVAVLRRGKYLVLDLEGGLSLLSHLGMSGRWLFHPRAPRAPMAHVHARIRFGDGSQLWFQDPRRFGLLRVAGTGGLAADPSLALLGIDPVQDPPTGAALRALAEGSRVSVKGFLLDQRRIAGIGNIYASEILHRAGQDPRTPAGAVRPERWTRIAREMRAVLEEAIERCGTTFSAYRTLWGQPGGYGDRLRVYDRAGEPCGSCAGTVRRIVQGARSTFYCPRCQTARPGPDSPAGGPGRRAARPRTARPLRSAGLG